MEMEEHLTDEQKRRLERALTEDGYASIEEWMQDSDYVFCAGCSGDSTGCGWVDLDDNPVGDPWIVYFWAKSAEAEAVPDMCDECWGTENKHYLSCSIWPHNNRKGTP